MVILYSIVLGLLFHFTQSLQNDSLKTTNLNETIVNKNEVTNSNGTIPQEITNTMVDMDASGDRSDVNKTGQQQPHQIKEDDKNRTQTTVEHDSEVITLLAESLVLVNDSKETEKLTTSSVAPFSPSPYLGSVIEDVIEEPIAQNRDYNGQTDFIPMKSRQNFNNFIDEAQLPQQYIPFHTSPSVTPVLGGSYSLHTDNAINDDFDSTNFNENPFGRIKFPDEMSKYYPLFLNENEIGTREKPLKFDFDWNYKQYDFPYKIENSGHKSEEVEKEPLVLDKTLYANSNKNGDSDHTVHGPDIMKNLNKSLPLEMKKGFSMKPRHNTWKKVAHTVMAFLPIGLMLAAIPPRVIKVNSTSQYPAREDVPPSPTSVNRFFKENINSRQAL